MLVEEEGEKREKEKKCPKKERTPNTRLLVNPTGYTLVKLM